MFLFSKYLKQLFIGTFRNGHKSVISVILLRKAMVLLWDHPLKVQKIFKNKSYMLYITALANKKRHSPASFNFLAQKNVFDITVDCTYGNEAELCARALGDAGARCASPGRGHAATSRRELPGPAG